MTIDSWLKQSVLSLKNTGNNSARLDCLLLIEDCLGVPREKILASPDRRLNITDLSILSKSLQRRLDHEPMAYILGKADFYGREFLVDKNVLVPRPESEDLINLLKEITPRPNTIIEIGTGSGCLAITAKLELPNVKVVAIDIDSKAIQIAEKNARNLTSKVKFYTGDLLNSIPISTSKKPVLILANLPYVPDEMEVNKPAMFEPKLALFGGPDGLDLYRKLFQSLGSDKRVQYVLTESLGFQHQNLKNIAKDCSYKLIKTSGLAQLFSFEETPEA